MTHNSVITVRQVVWIENPSYRGEATLIFDTEAPVRSKKRSPYCHRQSFEINLELLF